MTITANDIITRLWEIANLEPSKTKGKVSQKSAFKLILDLTGGAGFVAGRPGAELEELARRGVCSADLRTILREMMQVDLAWCRGSDIAACETQMARLKRAAAQSTNSRSNNPTKVGSVSRSVNVSEKQQKACSKN